MQAENEIRVSQRWDSEQHEAFTPEFLEVRCQENIKANFINRIICEKVNRAAMECLESKGQGFVDLADDDSMDPASARSGGRKKKWEVPHDLFFCVGASKIWEQPTHRLVKGMARTFGITWMRPRMSYHRFSNLRMCFGGDLSTKLMKGVKSLDFEELPCNCTSATKRCGECIYGGRCRVPLTIYKCICWCCGQYYIGNTQHSTPNSGLVNIFRKLEPRFWAKVAVKILFLTIFLTILTLTLTLVLLKMFANFFRWKSFGREL